MDRKTGHKNRETGGQQARRTKTEKDINKYRYTEGEQKDR